MRTIAIFGVTGRTGQALAQAATERGWAVRGFARPESAVPSAQGALTIVRGTFEDSARVIETVTGADAVCCVVGPRPPHTDAFCSAATTAIVHAMKQAGLRRLVCQTGAMVGEGNRTRGFAWLGRMVARRQRTVIQDRLEQERVVQESGLEWTLVKPPRLTEGPARRGIKAGATLPIGLLSRISRASLAAFTLYAIERGHYIGARVFVRE